MARSSPLDERRLLAALREGRGFVTSEVAAAKLGRLTQWFSANQLDAAVVGVSGGVDSALVLALLYELQKRNVLRRVVAMLLPIHGRATTGQARATARGRSVAEALGAELWEAPLAAAQVAMMEALTNSAGLASNAWSDGQVASIMRTPALYGAAALLQQHGYRSVVVGTTNRDEGAYLGFFGKASDGAVDLQPISDLHKSEVRALARHFRVPEEIVTAVPAGDVHDGRSDEEMIGASYDEVEMVVRVRELERGGQGASRAAVVAIAEHHTRNAHKYAVGNAAVHLDVMPRGVPDGWSDEVLSGRTEKPPPAAALAGAWELPPLSLDAISTWPSVEPVAVAGFAREVGYVLSAADCARLREAMRTAPAPEAVGVTGVRDSYGAGSVRATAFCPALARALFARLRPALPSVRFLDAHAPTDHFATASRTGHRTWRLVGLSPLLRFMRYDKGGQHFCHYDAGFDYGDGRRTLLSVVFYLADAAHSGATRFVRDGQEHRPTRERNFEDWARETAAHEIVARVAPREGAALVFDHRLPHDVERWDGPGARIIIRADVVYEAIPDGRS